MVRPERDKANISENHHRKYLTLVILVYCLNRKKGNEEEIKHIFETISLLLKYGESRRTISNRSDRYIIQQQCLRFETRST